MAKDGKDPTAEKQALKEALTVSELIDRYLDEGPATKPAKRASSWVGDGSSLKRHILPQIGLRLANHVTKAEAARAIQGIATGKTKVDEKSKKKRGRAIVTGGEGVARRTRAVTAAMFAWGIEHGYCASNPFSGVKQSAPRVCERFLSRDEAGRLLDALKALEDGKSLSKTFGDAIRLLMLTGARKTEILGLRWGEIDTDRQQLLLPAERTKAGGKNGERRISLSPPALAVLSARRPKDATTEAFVFPGARGDGHATGLRRAFVAACKEAKLNGVRIHDLRHSFASFALADGASLFLIGKLLGHASARTTERYAHLSGDPLQEAAALVGKRLMERPAKPQEPDDEAFDQVDVGPAPTGKGEVVQFPMITSR